MPPNSTLMKKLVASNIQIEKDDENPFRHLINDYKKIKASYRYKANFEFLS